MKITNVMSTADGYVRNSELELKFSALKAVLLTAALPFAFIAGANAGNVFAHWATAYLLEVLS